MFFVAMIVGLMEVGPGVCQLELLNPDGSISTTTVGCDYFVLTEEPTIPYRTPVGP